MNIQTSIETCFNKYATFSGRASRSEYWFFILFYFLGSIVTLIIDVNILGYALDSEYTPLNSIFSIILFIPSIAVACRRLHDVNQSGWWQLIWLTVIGGILLFIWYVTDGEKRKNRFGAPTKIKK
jgi:uncharacterized membrane protein YhaH (DUF805 family)